MAVPHVMYQPSLLDVGTPSVERSWGGLARHELIRGAWVDRLAGWVRGSDALFERLLHDVAWQASTVHTYDRKLVQPRLTARVDFDGEGCPQAPPELVAMRDALSERYGRPLGACFLNLYRDGRDSVAWHGDRVARELETALVATVSLGEARPFLLRPKGGGASTKFLLGRGDLLVMGGTTQRTWEHSVPKVRRAGPRISITLRDFDPTASPRRS